MPMVELTFPPAGTAFWSWSTADVVTVKAIETIRMAINARVNLVFSIILSCIVSVNKHY